MRRLPRVTLEVRERRTVGATLIALSLVAALVVPVGTFGAKGGANAMTPWISLSGVDGALAVATAQPHLGSEVTFAAGYPHNVNNPRIYVHCYQAGDLVFGMAGGVSEPFLLGGGGSIWLERGGAASCLATLYYYGWRAGTQTYNPLAETTFAAD